MTHRPTDVMAHDVDHFLTKINRNFCRCWELRLASHRPTICDGSENMQVPPQTTSFCGR
jgi:hypothetical protein